MQYVDCFHDFLPLTLFRAGSERLGIGPGDSVAASSRPGKYTLFDPRIMTGQLATGERVPR